VESFFEAATLKDIGASTLLLGVVIAVLTDRLVPGRRLRAEQKRADTWQQMTLDLLGVANRMTKANETAVEIVDQKLQPDLVAEAIKRIALTPGSDTEEGGALREAARLVAEEAARRVRGQG
jgi:hypothetical protein